MERQDVGAENRMKKKYWQKALKRDWTLSYVS